MEEAAPPPPATTSPGLQMPQYSDEDLLEMARVVVGILDCNGNCGKDHPHHPHCEAKASFIHVQQCHNDDNCTVVNCANGLCVKDVMGHYVFRGPLSSPAAQERIAEMKNGAPGGCTACPTGQCHVCGFINYCRVLTRLKVACCKVVAPVPTEAVETSPAPPPAPLAPCYRKLTFGDDSPEP